QMSFIQSKSLGFESDHVIMVPMRTEGASSQYLSLKTAFSGIAGVRAISAATSLPSTPLSRDWLIHKQGSSNDNSIAHDIVSVDENYFKTLGMSLIAGRDFLPEQDNLSADTISATKIIVNEASLKAFDIATDKAVGSSVFMQVGDDRYEFSIIGIAPDFHHFSLHRSIRPMLFILPGERNYFPYMAIAVNMSAYNSIRESMASVWDERVTDVPFENIFLNENVKTMYAAEQRTTTMLTISTCIALLISCLGLYGLSVFVAERKTKEIGIRKVVGASVESLVGLLSKEYVKLIVISFFISIPLGYYFMQKWLEGFAYRIEPGVLVFIVSGLIAFMIAWLTISFESFKAARRNPAETLRVN
ncbi:MAG TPA: FtsX-like permease family protein, partial [Chryseosolibacter sp.]|nr:FtsX-like permease family protein [Chryseosolibacter sp.]